jgi:hypothetical protein
MEKTALSRWVRAWHGISKPRGAKVVHRHDLGLSDVIWALGGLCALSRKPFDADLLTRQLPPPTTTDTLITGARSLGFRIRERAQPANRLGSLNLRQPAAGQPTRHLRAGYPGLPAGRDP